MSARKLALPALTAIVIAAGGAAINGSAHATATSPGAGRSHVLGQRITGRISQITSDSFTVDFRNRGPEAVQFRDIWRIRKALATGEPGGTTVIDYAGNRLFVAARLSDVIAAARGKLALTKFTAPNGQAIYLSAAKVTGVSHALPALHSPLSKTVIGTASGSQQVQEPTAAVQRIMDEARAQNALFPDPPHR
jgi:hypothetical protein